MDDENAIASDALVFMLVSLRKSWKYPIGYVLICKNNPDVRQLKSALQKILLRVSNVSSRSSNCQLFEKDVSPIFAVKMDEEKISCK